MTTKHLAEMALEQGQGILRLAPNWVPRSFCVPGRRIKLHPDDYYALGGERGGIDERWFSSTTPADNGPLTAPNEGLSSVVFEDGGHTGRSAPARCRRRTQGRDHRRPPLGRTRRWPMYSKFFDNQGALAAPHPPPRRTRAGGGPARQARGLLLPAPGQQPRRRLPLHLLRLRARHHQGPGAPVPEGFTKGDNKITNISKAYRLESGTGWDVPPGILHAPGSLCTYEPQKASDVFAMYQSLVGDQIVAEELLWKDTPEDKVGDVDYLIEVIDWERTSIPKFARQPLHAAHAGRDPPRRWRPRATTKTGSATGHRPSAPRN